MPADYSKIEQYKNEAAAKNYEAAGMTSTAFTLPDTIMNAVREDRTARGVSKLATDTGNVMGQMVTDPNAIRGVQEQGLMDPFSVNALTSGARAQNLQTLGTVSTQLSQNQGSLDQVIQAGANQLLARAEQYKARAKEAEQQANSLQAEWDRMFKEKEFTEGVRQFNVAKDRETAVPTPDDYYGKGNKETLVSPPMSPIKAGTVVEYPKGSGIYWTANNRGGWD